jgi:hypothetical protein
MRENRVILELVNATMDLATTSSGMLAGPTYLCSPGLSISIYSYHSLRYFVFRDLPVVSPLKKQERSLGPTERKRGLDCLVATEKAGTSYEPPKAWNDGARGFSRHRPRLLFRCL